MSLAASPSVPEVERWMERLYVAADGATLRREDRRKALEVAAMLAEIARAARRGRGELTLVDAAAGKAYVGLLAAKLVLEPARRRARVITLERDARRAALARDVAARLDCGVAVECRACEVADAAAWPERPDVVVALHACGKASDDVIDSAIAVRAKWLLLVPCCYLEGNEDLAEELGIAHQAPIRRRFLQSFIDSERTLRLEAAGYEVTVSELVPPTVTPHNLVWRARLAGEPRRMQLAADQRERLLSSRAR